jgi:epoxide hydrolase-like predicted phosphatase
MAPVTPWRAVLFDLGGVVMGSPLHAIADYERELCLPPGAVNRLVVATGPAGAWSQLERGELALADFFPLFDAECRAAGHELSAREMMERIGRAAQPRPRMVGAVRQLRAHGLRTAALTNNWRGDDTEQRDWLPALFDVVVESAREGVRKPDPRIYAPPAATRAAPSAGGRPASAAPPGRQSCPAPAPHHPGAGHLSSRPR